MKKTTNYNRSTQSKASTSPQPTKEPFVGKKEPSTVKPTENLTPKKTEADECLLNLLKLIKDNFEWILETDGSIYAFEDRPEKNNAGGWKSQETMKLVLNLSVLSKEVTSLDKNRSYPIKNAIEFLSK